MSKGSLCADLDCLARILRQEGICTDVTPLSRVAGELNKSSQRECNLQKLKFNIGDVPRNTVPSNVKLLEVILNVRISEKECLENQISNPIIGDYNFSIEISGQVDGNKVISHWHLDFDSDSKSEYVHPDFHLTFGGGSMKDLNLGQVLLLPAPRLSHPPMDAILGVDLIIRNFYKKDKIARLLENSQYRKVIENSQKRLWRPYILAIAGHWCNFSCGSFKKEIGLCEKYVPYLKK